MPGGIECVDMISAYPDRQVATTSDEVIKTLTEMADEEKANNVGHFNRKQL